MRTLTRRQRLEAPTPVAPPLVTDLAEAREMLGSARRTREGHIHVRLTLQECQRAERLLGAAIDAIEDFSARAIGPVR